MGLGSLYEGDSGCQVTLMPPCCATPSILHQVRGATSFSLEDPVQSDPQSFSSGLIKAQHRSLETCVDMHFGRHLFCCIYLGFKKK